MQQHPQSFALLALLLGPIGCTTADKSVAESQRDERSDLSADQSEQRAAFERKQQDERSGLTADQAHEIVEGEMANVGDQRNFAIDARERLAKLDARVVELRKNGRRVDDGAMAARDAIVTHIAVFDDEVMARTVWTTHKDQLNSELSALSNRLDQIAKG